MVVDAVGAAALLLGGGGHLADVAVVVIDPAESDILGYLQPGIVGLQHLLVGTEHLRHGCRVANFLVDEAALVGDDFLQRGGDVLGTAVALDGAVVHAAHTKGIYHVLVLRLFYPLCPVLLHTGHVGFVVPTAVRSALVVPLEDIVPEHGLTVAAAQYDVIATSHLGIPGVVPESLGTLVHGRPEDVGTQAQQQFADAGVGVRTYILDVGVHVLGRPGLYAPVFVVDEDAAELDARLADGERAIGGIERRARLGGDICPPHPRRDAHQAR